jgi:hypothetical protein
MLKNVWMKWKNGKMEVEDWRDKNCTAAIDRVVCVSCVILFISRRKINFWRVEAVRQRNKIGW